MMLERHPIPVLFGEALFDYFPDGSKVLGGAPLNVAWHLQGFGAEPHMVSAVGDDSAGDEIIERMQEWGLSTDCITTLSNDPTGNVMVTIQGQSSSFMIELEQAFDFIPPCTSQPLDFLYFGTLILRSEVSRSSLIQLHNLAQKVFVDINIREPWFNEAYLPVVLTGASAVKVSQEELAQLTHGDVDDEVAIRVALEKLQSHYLIDTIYLTMGDQGAWYWGRQEQFYQKANPVEHFVDSVGAGDAFSAVAFLGEMQGWEPAVIMQRALAFSSRVCEQHGAIDTNKAFYASVVNTWR